MIYLSLQFCFSFLTCCYPSSPCFFSTSCFPTIKMLTIIFLLRLFCILDLLFFYNRLNAYFFNCFLIYIFKHFLVLKQAVQKEKRMFFRRTKVPDSCTFPWLLGLSEFHPTRLHHSLLRLLMFSQLTHFNFSCTFSLLFPLFKTLPSFLHLIFYNSSLTDPPPLLSLLYCTVCSLFLPFLIVRPSWRFVLLLFLSWRTALSFCVTKSQFSALSRVQTNQNKGLWVLEERSQEVGWTEV